MQLVNTIFIEHSGLMVSILNTGLKLFIHGSHALVLYLHYYIKPYHVRMLSGEVVEAHNNPSRLLVVLNESPGSSIECNGIHYCLEKKYY